MIRFADNQPEFVKDWMLFASMDIDVLKGALLAACRHRSIFNSDNEYERWATQYKLEQIRGVRRGIAEGSIAARRMAVTRAIMLVLDEVRSSKALNNPSCTN